MTQDEHGIEKISQTLPFQPGGPALPTATNEEASGSVSQSDTSGVFNGWDHRGTSQLLHDSVLAVPAFMFFVCFTVKIMPIFYLVLLHSTTTLLRSRPTYGGRNSRLLASPLFSLPTSVQVRIIEATHTQTAKNSDEQNSRGDCFLPFSHLQDEFAPSAAETDDNLSSRSAEDFS